VAALEPGRTSWTAVLDAVRLGPDDDVAEVTAAQVRAVVQRLITAGRWHHGDPDVLVVFDAGYDLARLAFLLADLPVEVLGRLRSDRVFRLPAPPRAVATIGRPAKHGGEFQFADPGRWPDPDVVTLTDTSRYGRASATAWDRLHPRLTRRAAWLEYDGDLPVLEGTLIRLTVDHLPGDGDPKPLWLWSSSTRASPSHVDRLWQTFVRRFDLEHTFRFFKQTLGWTAPRLRDPHAADRVDVDRDRRLYPASSGPAPHRGPAPALGTARTRGPTHPGTRASRVSEPAREDHPTGRCTETHHRRPGCPPGSRNRRPATRHDVGKTTKRGITLPERKQRSG
jgi:SAM-dependent methyltransferase